MTLIPQRLRQRVTTLTAACAVIITTLGFSSAPAQASSDKALKLLLGATAVAIIAHGASRSHAAPPTRHYHKPHATPPKYYRHAPRNARRLPHQCSTRYVYRGQRHAGYLGSCLRQFGVRNIPQTCHVRRQGGQIYSASCLSRHGYRRG